MRRVARVLIDSPLPQLDRLFDYAVPSELDEDAVVGARVKVPLRTVGRVVDAYVIERDEVDDAERPLSELDAVVSVAQVLPTSLYALSRKVADRAAGSAVDILRLAIPKRQVRVEKAWLAAEPPSALELPADILAAAAERLDAFPDLRDALAEDARIALDAPPFPVPLTDGTTVLAWAPLFAAAAADTLARGRSTVLVVPDYRDEQLLLDALADLLPAEVVVRHDARQTGPERYRGFLRTLDDAPCVVVGNRSAVYAPVSSLGLIALWDDSDPLLEEPLAPYVHARDAALVRQELDGCALLVAGHTRSTDTERLVALGWMRELTTPRKASPRVVLSATTESERPGVRIPSAAYREAGEALASGPVLVQVSRPGYSPVLVCGECRKPARCTHCGGPLSAHARGAVPTCRWCSRRANGWRCQHCDASTVRLASSGSERTADELGRAFPNTRVIVADGDHIVERVDARPALVVATRGAEPVADGGYAAVILLDGDRMLLADDLRIAESTLRWWSNAAALAAPGSPVHLVGVTGQVARALATWNQPAFARMELGERAPVRMPPAVRVASLEGTPAEVDAAIVAVRQAAPLMAPDAVVGPIRADDGDVQIAKALIRFDYGHGAAVTSALRAAVVAAALRTRRTKARAVRTTLRVRVDVLDPQL